MNVEVSGLLGLILLILDVYAIVKIVGSGATTGTKVLWIVLILLLPFLGLILWWLLGPKSPGSGSRAAFCGRARVNVSRLRPWLRGAWPRRWP